MTSWRKFKKQYKKDAAKRIYDYLVTFTDNAGNCYKGTLKGFKPQLITNPNGKKHVELDALIENVAKVIANKYIDEAECHKVSNDGSLAIEFSVRCDTSQTIKDILGL